MKTIWVFFVFSLLISCYEEQPVRPVVLRDECQIIDIQLYSSLPEGMGFLKTSSPSKLTKVKEFRSYLTENDFLRLVTRRSGDEYILISLEYSAEISSQDVYDELKSKILGSLKIKDGDIGYYKLEGDSFAFSSGTCTISVFFKPPQNGSKKREDGAISIELYDPVFINN